LFTEDFDFACELKVVGCVLVMAASATAEERARRLRALRRGLKHLIQIGVNAALNLHARFLARQHERCQNDSAVHARETFAAVHPLVD
jgi:hypothetical protein